MEKNLKQTLKKSRYFGIYQILKRILLIAWRRITGQDQRHIKNYLSRSGIKGLHLGCGFHILEDWLNTDYFPRYGQVVYLNAVARYPFPENSFDFVFSEHLFEHLTFSEGEKMLRECFRVLKPGGRIRITTPNFDFLVDLHQDENSEIHRNYIKWFMNEFAPDFPFSDPAIVINQYVRKWGHKFIYTASSLGRLMESAGFSEITSCEIGRSELKPLANLENDSRMPAGYLALESITLEGSKN